MVKLLITIIVFSFSCEAFALEKITKSEMDLGRLSYSAYECSVVSAWSHNKEEQRRLFLLGFDSADKFFTLSSYKEIESGLVSDHISYTLATIEVLNNDFANGRLYQNVYEYVFSKVGNLGDLKKQKIDAEKYYNFKNCSLIKE